MLLLNAVLKETVDRAYLLTFCSVIAFFCNPNIIFAIIRRVVIVSTKLIIITWSFISPKYEQFENINNIYNNKKNPFYIFYQIITI